MAAFSILSPFSHRPIDRQSVRRSDAAWIAQAAAGGGLFLPVDGGKVAVGGADEPRLEFRGAPVGDPDALVFLGVRDDVAYFASLGAAPDGLRMEELRGVAPRLPREEASLAAYAVGLSQWHARHRFCGVCGSATLPADAGHRRICVNAACGAIHFPRTDPAIIVLVEQGDACFLARNAHYRPGMHSTLAGFVEPGETLEAAVEREVWEEAQIALDSIRYQASQPWPFPASLMVGYRARAASREFKVDGVEIVDGGWFTREQVTAALDLPSTDTVFNLPGRLSISRALIEDWLDRPGDET